MTKKSSVILLLTSMAVSAIIIISSVSYSVDKQKATAEKKARQTTAVTTQLEIGYYLKEYQGEIAIFRGENETPFKKLGVTVDFLSDYDKILLHDGIFAADKTELQKLIEDYTS